MTQTARKDGKMKVPTSYCDDGHLPILIFHHFPDDDPMCILCRQLQRIEILKTELSDKDVSIGVLKGELRSMAVEIDELHKEVAGMVERNQPEETWEP